MTDKIAYFTAGPIPTPAELDEIETLRAGEAPAVAVAVMSATSAADYGLRPNLDPILGTFHFANGTVPPEFAELDPYTAPAPLSIGDTVTLTDAEDNEVVGTVTAIEGGVVITLPEGSTIVTE